MEDLRKEIERRRTFAIISHPDAGKTTLTEKLLLYGGAIRLAGSVKSRKSKNYAVSDWMEIEKQRGISVTSSVMQFNYDGYCINILDTPGHQDFSEDTYRTLMAADSAVMVVDAAKGVEDQTRKLFNVCSLRNIPIFTIVNKMDREARDPFELMEEIENELGIKTYPMNWPIGSGKDFKGVYERSSSSIQVFSQGNHGQNTVHSVKGSVDDQVFVDLIGEDFHAQLKEEIELLDIAGDEFDMGEVLKGNLSPVFFASALTNFGVEPFLKAFLEMTSSPLPRSTSEGEEIDVFSEDFSAFVFKIQANMNPAHRDRIAFVRVCSGTFERGMDVTLERTKKKMKLSNVTQFMADARENIQEAVAGDIIGVYDTGNYQIGDTIFEGKLNVSFEDLPSFTPELFMKVSAKNVMKQKSFHKGIYQLVQEGAIQLYKTYLTEEYILGAVGQLQFEVFQHRMLNEYNSEVVMTPMGSKIARWIDPKDLDEKMSSSRNILARDRFDQPLFLFENQFAMRWFADKYPEVELKSLM